MPAGSRRGREGRGTRSTPERRVHAMNTGYSGDSGGSCQPRAPFAVAGQHQALTGHVEVSITPVRPRRRGDHAGARARRHGAPRSVRHARRRGAEPANPPRARDWRPAVVCSRPGGATGPARRTALYTARLLADAGDRHVESHGVQGEDTWPATPRPGPTKRPGPPRLAAANPGTIAGQVCRRRGAFRDRGRPAVTRDFPASASVAVGSVHAAQLTIQTAASLPNG